ncbi:MAG: amidohydrolase family protein [Gammaproteobacteria bacterium]|nr:amidohydrolase family protein [Gammaproteobacteria bacterium]
MKNCNALLAVLIFLLTHTIAAADTEDNKWDVNRLPGSEAARDIAINTTTGTWMSLDVSPDGRTIAFDLLGDIYTLPITGGNATAVHTGLSWSMQPRFSPDGRHLAFTSDAGGGDNIWIMQRDGTEPRQLTREDFRLLNNPYWSPDGRYIAARKHFTTYRSLGTGEIWLYHRNGGGGVAMVEKPNEQHQKELGEPAFSPDGRYLYFSLDSTPGSQFQYAQDSNGQIFEIRRHDLHTGITESFVTGAGGAVRPTPSPDGKHLAFVRRIRTKSALFLKDLTSGAERPIYTGLDQDVQEVWAVHGVYPNMDWMPDSKSIVFWAGGKINRIDIDSLEVTDIPFRVTDTRTVYEAPGKPVDVAPATFNTTMVRNAEISPDGTRVVFESAGFLYLKKLPNGPAKRLTKTGDEHFEYDPTWSRDSRHIAFVSWSDDDLGHIHKVRASGGRSKRLTKTPGHFHEPRFSPDGSVIVFSAHDGGSLTSPDWSIDSGVFSVPADGGAARRVTPDGHNPHFGSSSERLYVTRRASNGEGLELVSINLDGEAPRTHATGKYLRRVEVAPDDRHLAFRENYHIYALPLPPGGKPLELGTKVSSVPMTKASGDGGNFPNWSDNGQHLHWTLGATLYSAATDRLFAPPGDEEDKNAGYTAPTSGVSMSRQLTADVPDSVVAITGARIITMADADGGVIENGIIIIRNNRIAAVGDSNLEIPTDAVFVHLTDKTIIPGLIDAHAHGSQGVGIIPQQNWKNYATLALGVTTIFDPSNDATEIFAAAEMQRTGQILAPRIYSTGNIIYGAKSSYFAEINSLDDAREHVRRLKAQGAIAVKNYNQPRREQRQQVTTAAREENLLVVSEGGSLYHMDMSMIADGNSAIEHNVPQSMLYDDVLQFWSQTNVAYTPTLVVTFGGLTAEKYWYQATDVWKHPILSNFVPPQVLQPASVRRITAPDSDFYHTTVAANARRLTERGVNVSIGAHGQREGLASHWEIWGFAQGGMSPVEALKSATLAPAQKLHMEADLGSLEAGKLADLVILEANPLENIFATDKVNMVMLNGRLYDASTLHEIVTGTRETKPFYWQKSE